MVGIISYLSETILENFQFLVFPGTKGCLTWAWRRAPSLVFDVSWCGCGLGWVQVGRYPAILMRDACHGDVA